MEAVLAGAMERDRSSRGVIPLSLEVLFSTKRKGVDAGMGNRRNPLTACSGRRDLYFHPFLCRLPVAFSHRQLD